MFKCYTILLIVFCSCGSHLNYLGSSYTPSRNVDVYVDASAIKKAYTVIGKGFMEYGYMSWSAYGKSRIEKMQKKAVEKARAKGADAVLFQDYLIKKEGTRIQSISTTDSVGKGLVTVETGTIGPIISSGTNIWFLKYD
jgi:hypothetical protein